MLIKNGYMSIEEAKSIPGFPSEERMKEGPVAVIECAHEIPCNPCEDSCRFGAIQVGTPITQLPELVEDKCVACGVCVTQCPGLAIVIVDKSRDGDEGTVAFPFEYYPLPEIGQEVDAVSRSGEFVCKGRVTKVMDTKVANHTPVVTVAVDKKYVDTVRSMKRLSLEDQVAAPFEDDVDLEAADFNAPEDMVVCRCEEITVGEIKQAIKEGAIDVNGVKRRTRAGMGLCQGRSCEKLVQAIIRQELGNTSEEISQSTARLPVKPVSFGALAGGQDNENL